MKKGKKAGREGKVGKRERVFVVGRDGWFWGRNQGPCACKSHTLLLSSSLGPIGNDFRVLFISHNIREK